MSENLNQSNLEPSDNRTERSHQRERSAREIEPVQYPEARNTKQEMIDMTLPNYSKFVTMKAKTAGFFKNCVQKENLIQQIRNKDPFKDKFGRADQDEAIGDQCVKLKIKGSGVLQLDELVLHPFVKVHIIDMNTNMYLAKSNKDQNGISSRETANIFKMVDDNQKKEPFNMPTDFLLPFSTRMYDMRIKGVNYCEWDEEFVINDDAKYVFKKDTLILFEILDFNPELVVEESEKLNADKLLPIAWAYLRPMGRASVHMNSLKLQLYKHQYRPTIANRYNRHVDPRCPDVLMELFLKTKEKYNSFLEVELRTMRKSNKEIQRLHWSRTPWEMETSQKMFTTTAIARVNQQGQIISQTMDKIDKFRDFRKWQKDTANVNFQSLLPNKLKKPALNTDKQGAFKIKFSNQGQYLAVACTTDHSKSIIKIFNILHDDEQDQGELAVLSGHVDIIHDLCWSWDDKFLVSASSDGSCKLWNMTNISKTHTDNLKYLINDSRFLLEEMFHPSFVYGAKFHPCRFEGSLYIGTICFDQKVRIWRVSVEDFENGNCFAEVECIKSIVDKPDIVIGTQKGLFAEDEDLNDDMLQLIMNPQDINESEQLIPPSKKEKKKAEYKKDIEKRHPNCMVFANDGTIFVGDSQGCIRSWLVSIQQSQDPEMVNSTEYNHKEITGDQINQIIMMPEVQNQIYVVCRDNSIKLLEFEGSKGPRVTKRYFGSKCSNQMVRCSISPDGMYLVSGSETGQPFIWEADVVNPYETKNYECNFGDSIADCDWNPVYNMFAFAGFGQEFPVLLYVYERDAYELDEMDRAAEKAQRDAALGDDGMPSELQEEIGRGAQLLSQGSFQSPKKGQHKRQKSFGAQSEGGARSGGGQSSDFNFAASSQHQSQFGR